jgi:hypothetical protein
MVGNPTLEIIPHLEPTNLMRLSRADGAFSAEIRKKGLLEAVALNIEQPVP